MPLAGPGARRRPRELLCSQRKKAVNVAPDTEGLTVTGHRGPATPAPTPLPGTVHTPEPGTDSRQAPAVPLGISFLGFKICAEVIPRAPPITNTTTQTQGCSPEAGPSLCWAPLGAHSLLPPIAPSHTGPWELGPAQASQSISWRTGVYSRLTLQAAQRMLGKKGLQDLF